LIYEIIVDIAGHLVTNVAIGYIMTTFINLQIPLATRFPCLVRLEARNK